MNKEEIKAIEYIKFKTIAGLETLQLEKDVKALEILLNYIDKLQKDSISKDIIRDKIKELEEEQKGKIWSINTDTKECSYVNINNKREIEVLKELLGE